MDLTKDQFVKQVETHNDLILLMARNCQKEGLNELADEIYNLCLQYKNDKLSNLQFRVANLLFKADKKFLALTLLKQAHEQDTDHKGILSMLYHVYRSNKQFEKSLVYLTKIIQNNTQGNIISHHQEAGVLNIKINLPKQALKHLYVPLIWQEERTSSTLLQIGKSLLKLKQYKLCELYLRKALYHQPSNKRLIVFELIQCLKKSNQHIEIPYLYVQYQDEIGSSSKFNKPLSKLLMNLKQSNSDLNSQRRIICVLGMHRSGTSCLAGAIQEAGFRSPNVMTWNQDNLQGNRESLEIIQLNERLLRYNDLSWNKIQSQKLTWTSKLEMNRDRLIQRRFDIANIWSFKDPRTVLTLPFWKNNEHVFIPVGTFRHPMKTAISLYVRNDISISNGLELWYNYNKKIFEYHEQEPFPLICFDSNTSDYLDQLDLLLNYLGDRTNKAVEIQYVLAHKFVDKHLETDLYNLDFGEFASANNLSAQYKNAMKSYDKLLKIANIHIKHKPTIDPNNRDLLQLLYNADKIKNPDRKLLKLEQGLEIFPDNQILVSKLMRYALKNKLHISAHALRLSTGVEHPKARLHIAQYLIEHDQVQSISLLKQLNHQYPQFADAQILLANQLVKNGKLKKANSLHQTIIELRPMNTEILIRLFRFAQMTGHRNHKLKYIKMTIENVPRNLYVIKQYINTLIEAKETEELANNYDRFYLDPRINFGTWMAIASFFIDQGQNNYAMPALMRLKELVQNDNQLLIFRRLRDRISSALFPHWFQISTLN